MDYMRLEQHGGDTVLNGVRHFCLDDILDCGQAFRWQKLAPGLWQGIVQGTMQTVRQEDSRLTFYNCTAADFDRIWFSYFDFARDYGEIKALLQTDKTMAAAVAFTPGMRVLRQEPWEVLASFILSQNNNIKRIRGLVQSLCENFGQPVQGGFAFPTPQRLAACTVEELAPVRAGFRAKYLLDAAQKVAAGELDFQALYTLPEDAACEQLRRIHGVGPKVARCALLYGFARAQCVPVDVWILRALQSFYPQGLPDEILPVAGIGQQYLFHYMRHAQYAPQI